MHIGFALWSKTTISFRSAFLVAECDVLAADGEDALVAVQALAAPGAAR